MDRAQEGLHLPARCKLRSLTSMVQSLNPLHNFVFSDVMDPKQAGNLTGLPQSSQLDQKIHITSQTRHITHPTQSLTSPTPTHTTPFSASSPSMSSPCPSVPALLAGHRATQPMEFTQSSSIPTTSIRPPAVNSSLTGHPSKLASPPTAWPSLLLLPPLTLILPILFTKPHSSENDHIFINFSSFSSSLSILFS
ncbi:hypothetical protein B9Z19DRAFT_844834 [Tuber borchii]|uniref:Uncharacterized protein n=1 Tax=Tuber borchii TaxID=42251 RepID=A0A2T6ZUJ5_TUBBO|nr:hypothetical protein B9Z19DRAFT_844834 [Tuber borchii]